ncbi:CsbD family protein [Microvirga yunnanensis]|uniref:CsbD family protein n=1 Tax=Microvirga yunnanensis TaxID=2953740 RepID=UPI0021C585AE|nr:CsbD family protein [Microvirga sp. HBU65207]
MDKDRVAGSAKQTKGSVKEAIGKITGDSKIQAEGSSEKIAGKAQNAVGGIKDTMRDATKPR